MRNKGQTLVELLITIALAAILIPALLVGFSITRSSRAQQSQRLAATAYMREAQEATRTVAASAWTNLSNGTFHPVVSGSTWALVSGPETINSNFTRQIVISDVSRNSSGTIVTSGGTVDPSTKKIVVSVSWVNPLVSSVSGTTYLTRHNNLSHIETTLSDFSPGSTNSATTDVVISNTDGGEIILSAGGGGGDWCTPSPIIASLDLPKNGVANAVSAIEGKISAGTGENASGVSFANVNVNTAYPPVPVIQATFDGYKTNDVFGEEDYAYLATDNNSKEIVIIDLNNIINGKYQEIGYFNAPGNGSGNSIIKSGSWGYMTSGNKLYSFNLTSKNGSRPLGDPDGLTLAGTGTEVVVVGTYAYVSISGSALEMQIINLSDPNNMTVVGQADVNGQAAKSVFVNSSGTRAYLATGVSSTQREFFIVDTSTKTGNRPTLGNYDTNGMNPKGLTVVTGNRAIIVGTGGTNQYQVININNENAPTNCGNLQVPTGVNGVSSVLQSDGYAYSYIITGDSTTELKVILGGAGGGNNYNPSGVFESATFDAGSEVAWNSILTTAAIPENTTLQLKIALKHGVNNSCSNVSFSSSDFVGSDGLTSSFFPSTGGVLPFSIDGASYENPARCARYRVYLETSDITQTPVVYDVSLNYSP